MPVPLADVVKWITSLQAVYHENRQYLTDLDAAIGDADHGSNLDRGFTSVISELGKTPPGDIAGALKLTAMTLIRTVGGASGPLYGTFFLRASAACNGLVQLERQDVLNLFKAGIEGIQQRGKAEPGDKTMLDALLPAFQVMQTQVELGTSLSELLDLAAQAAEQGMAATVPLQAKKGRASYLGPRSVGHQDPGATSAAMLVRTAANSWRS